MADLVVSFGGGLKRLNRDLRAAETKAVPEAARYALTQSAWKARASWQGNIRSEFTTRTKFTERSIRAVPARGSSVDAMVSKVGTELEYLEDQEKGATLRGKGKSKPIPRTAARTGRSFSKLVARPNKLQAIDLQNEQLSKFRQKGQRIAVATRLAKKAGKRFVFVDTGQTRAIYRIHGPSRRPKLRTIWDLSRRSVRIQPTNMMERSVKEIRAELPALYAKALRFQFRRLHILGY